jgi:hypothetical protein
LIASTLRYLDFIEGEITYLKKAVGERLGSFTKALSWLATIPGVGSIVSKHLWSSAVWT